MANDDFYIINSWMIDDLGLSGVELQCFAIIWSLSRGKKQMYIAGNSHLVKMTKKCEHTIITALKSLREKGLIKKVPTVVNNVERNFYKAITKGSKLFTEEENNNEEGYCKNCSGGTAKISVPNKESKEESNNKEKRLSNDNQKVEYSDDFIEFWKAYGYSVDKQETYKRWKKLSKKDKEDALKAIPDYFSDCVNHNRQKRYPAVYISKRTWENDYCKNNTVEEIPEERLDGWERSQEWMRKFIPRIAGRITFTDFDTMRGTVYHNREVFSDILQEINNSDYEGDIVKEFCRLSQTKEYNKRIFGI